MPLPPTAARFSTRFVSPLMRHVSGRLPGFATLEHRGRVSGRVYRTPVNVFVAGDRASFALTYGRDAEWVRNVISAGGCVIETAGRRLALDRPRIVTDPSRELVPWLVRIPLALLRVDEFLVLRRRVQASDHAEHSGPAD
jgi:deazaflavin-dependent oxidoreductase (nitroreductase family)